MVPVTLAPMGESLLNAEGAPPPASAWSSWSSDICCSCFLCGCAFWSCPRGVGGLWVPECFVDGRGCGRGGAVRESVAVPAAFGARQSGNPGVAGFGGDGGQGGEVGVDPVSPLQRGDGHLLVVGFVPDDAVVEGDGAAGGVRAGDVV